MEKHSLSSIQPGEYQFRPNPFVPWMKVKVFKESSAHDENLRICWSGGIIDASKLINRGEWKPIKEQITK
ncbi:hypothetical protein [Aliikangiella sp. IMCC44359]|uniref:hypothetical protein n=1 Tax=Aliikangiella sp. IMCC44359 TaxID=3459125 RepID=UPI00403AFFA6